MEINPSYLDSLLDNDKRYNSFIKSMAKGLAENNEKWFDIKPILSATFNRTLHHINSGAPVMFISACTSKLENETDDEHNKRNKNNTLKLIDDVLGMKLSFIKINGHWVQYDNEVGEYRDFPESTLMVLGYDRYGEILDFNEFKDIAIKLRDKYNQWSVLVGRNLLDNKLDFKYYNSDDTTTNFGKVDVSNNKDVSKIVDEYNKELQDYINSDNIDKVKLKELKSKTNGWSEYKKNRNISLSSMVVEKRKPFFGSKEDNWLTIE